MMVAATATRRRTEDFPKVRLKLACGFSFLTGLMPDEAALTGRKSFFSSGRDAGRKHRKEPGTTGALIFCLLLTIFSGVSRADEPVYDLDIPAINAAEALNRFAEQTGAMMLFPYDLARARQANAVSGRYTLLEGLDLLLQGTGLSGGLSDRRVINISLTENEQRLAEEGRMPAQKVSLGRKITAFVASIFSVSAASGQDTEVGMLPLEEIIVTAQKREQTIEDVPMSVTAISDEELIQRGISSTVDIGLSVPGIAVTDRGGANVRYIFMRGLGNLNGSQAMVGIYLDEQDITSFPFFALDLRAYDMERLEVLRGPQGTLYGSGAMGGVLRYVTKSPDLSGMSGDAYVQASATESGDSSQLIGGALNVPLVKDALGLRASGYFENSGGWIDQPALLKSDINDEELYSFRVKGLWQPTDALQVSTLAMMHRNDTGAANVGEDQDGNYTQRLSRATTPSGSSDYETYNITVSYFSDRFDFTSSTGYFDLDTSYRQFGYIVPIAPPPATPFEIFQEAADAAITSFAQELRMSSVASEGVMWTVGATYRNAEKTNNAPFLFGLPGAATPIPLFEHASTESWAAFGEASTNLGDRLRLGAGLRYYEDRQKNLFTRQSGIFDQLSPRLFGTFSVTEDVNVYANIAKGFRSGGFNSATAIANGAPADYESDLIWSYELGSKGTLLSERLTFDVAAFYSDYKGAQDTGFVVINGQLVSLVGNLGDAVIQGVDWNIGLKVTSSFSIGTGGEYLDGEYTRINAVNTSVAVGDPLIQVPRYHANAWTMYQRPSWIGSDSAYIRVDYYRKGEAEYRNRSVGAHYFSVSDEIDLLNASAGWEKDNWSINVFARNLLNDRGYIDGESLELLAARARPRTYGMSLRVRFD